MKDKNEKRRRKTPTDASAVPTVSDLWRLVNEQAEQLNVLSRQVQDIRNQQEQARSGLDGLERLIPTVERGIDELHDVLSQRDFFPPKEVAYKMVVRRLREIVRTMIPPRRRLAFVGKPDRRLLNISGYDGWCFPQTRDGKYPGYYPASSLAAIAQLEAIRSKGAEYLVFPETSRWWFDQYPDFRRHLELRFRLVIDEPDTGLLYSLCEPPDSKNPLSEIAEILEGFELRHGRKPSVLDWHTELNLPHHFPDQAIFLPPSKDHVLPYLDGSVDVVIFPSTSVAEADEADRVANAVLIMVARGEGEVGHELSVRWKSHPATHGSMTTSIIIPCFNQIAHTEACLKSLRETLPPDFNGEILVVDDASTDDTEARLQARTNDGFSVTVIRNRKNLGFIGSCNKAARAATGEILVFLNNDTVCLPNWLPPLLRTFREHTEAGAVGGKLIYPEGILQEAGGLVFDDGSAANFGRDDQNPDHPLYSFLREVDYCSGALLATRRDLFLKLRCFDERYKPAFYEDTDYCFRIREAGCRVYFQPESAVVHFEGATSGTDLSSGTKRFQVINEAKFIQRWSSTLRGQPKRPPKFDFDTLQALAARPRSRPEIGMPSGRALVCALMPEYDRDSGSRRILHLVESLQEGGWAVTFVSHHANAGRRYVAALQRLGVEVYCGDKQWMDRLIGSGIYNLAVFGLWDIAEPYIPVIRQKSPQTRIIVDSIDLHFLRNSRRAFSGTNGNGVSALDSDYGSAMVREINTYASVDAVLAVSEKEAEMINNFVGETDLGHVVPDGEDTPASSLPLDERHGMVFVGCFRHTPNADAVAYLCKEIIPRVPPKLLARHPLYIVGDGMNDEIRRLGEGLDNVRMVGWVPSVEAYLQRARVSVVPLRYGAGTKRKLLQALLHGTPTVTTSIGAEGLKLQHGEQVLIEDDPVGFARSIVILLENDAEWTRLERSGSAHVRAFHKRQLASSRANEVVRSVFAKPGRKMKADATNVKPASTPLNREEYTQLVTEIRGTVENTLPPTAKVAVVSKGDEALLQLGNRRTWHFPQDARGQYLGYYPATSEEATAQVESLISHGADYLLFPKTAFWWMDHYTGLKKYIEKHFHLEVHREDTCSIYALHNGVEPPPAESIEVREVKAEFTGPDLQSSEEARAKLIAFFLPQFHPIRENDEWWGKGFTEWTNVAKARPLFPGHYQPHLPADLGFYDLRLPEVRENQANLARAHGLHGFCYYHYWFSGKQLLDRPFSEVLRSGEPDLPFCLCWANEPWSRRWDGRPRDVLQAQHYSHEDDVAHIRWLIPALADRRAIRIAGKPVFIVYQGKDLPDPKRTTDSWRNEALKAGLGELYLMTFETGWDAGWDATQAGFDAKILFQPQFAMLFNSGADVHVSAGQSLRVFDYGKAWPALANPEPVAYRRYDTVCVGWDNSARRGQQAVVLHGSTPDAYEQWLKLTISKTEKYLFDERVVFINAWNEWGEGCHLEPDQRHGRSYLEATRRALLLSADAVEAGRHK
jgi:GT2 family glycosyltransferase/glycosyltransferase involved in cell wall biosynthesis